MKTVPQTKPSTLVLHAWLEEINTRLGKLTQKQFELRGESSEGGALSGYYSTEPDNKENAKKIVAVLFAEMGRSTREFYLREGSLFCVLNKQDFYDKPMYVHDSKIVRTKITQYYFQAGELLEAMHDADKGMQIPREEVLQEARDFQLALKRYQGLLNRK